MGKEEIRSSGHFESRSMWERHSVVLCVCCLVNTPSTKRVFECQAWLWVSLIVSNFIYPANILRKEFYLVWKVMSALWVIRCELVFLTICCSFHLLSPNRNVPAALEPKSLLPEQHFEMKGSVAQTRPLLQPFLLRSFSCSDISPVRPVGLIPPRCVCFTGQSFSFLLCFLFFLNQSRSSCLFLPCPQRPYLCLL